jgi:hypothetical protein
MSLCVQAAAAVMCTVGPEERVEPVGDVSAEPCGDMGAPLDYRGIR